MSIKKGAVICSILVPIVAFCIGFGFRKLIQQNAFKKANLTQANIDTIKKCISQEPCAIYTPDTIFHIDSSMIADMYERTELFTIYMVCFDIAESNDYIFFPWRQDTVNIQIVDANPQDHLALRTILNDINATIHDVYFRTVTGKSPDITIKYEDRMSYKQILKDKKFTGYCKFTNSYFHICKEKAAIHILVDHENQRRVNMVLKHELLHALGFVGHYYVDPDPAIHYDCMALGNEPLSNCSSHLSKFDKRLLDIMYNKLKGVVVTKKQFKYFYDKESDIYYNKLKEQQVQR